jgi:hypothetical protein
MAWGKKLSLSARPLPNPWGGLFYFSVYLMFFIVPLLIGVQLVILCVHFDVGAVPPWAGFSPATWVWSAGCVR